METFEVDISFRDEDVSETEKSLKESGAESFRRIEEMGLTGVEVVIVTIVGVQALVNIVIKLSRIWRCGVVVDARSSRVRTVRDCSIPRGEVVVIGNDGDRVTFDHPSEATILPALSDLVGSASN